MYSYLSGTLIESQPLHAVVEVGGVGYSLHIPVTTYERLPKPGASVKLYTHLNVREDDMSLYGFISEGELNFFRLLLGVSGIGPKLGLSILSGSTPDELRSAVAQADVRRLTGIKGIGKKTAERIIVELKDKLKTVADDGEWLTGIAAGAEASNMNEAMAALETLGFSRNAAAGVVKKAAKALGDDAPPEALIRESLRNI